MPDKIPCFDRRITLQEPVTVTNDFNEALTEWETVWSHVPAARSEAAAGKEGLEGHVVRASGETEWQTRFLGFADRPRATWRIIDEYGDTYEIIAPPMEVGRRQGWKFKTRLIQ